MFFAENHRNYGGKASPRRFYEKHISRPIVWNVIQFVFIVYPSGGLVKLKLRC